MECLGELGEIETDDINCEDIKLKDDNDFKDYYSTIKQYILKAQEMEKVLEIIKKKEVDVAYLMCLLRNYNTDNFEIASMYNRANVSQFQLLPTEIDLLKRC